MSENEDIDWRIKAIRRHLDSIVDDATYHIDLVKRRVDEIERLLKGEEEGG